MNTCERLRPVRAISISMWLISAAIFLSGGPALGQQEIVIGHVAGYTGPAAKDASEMGLGAKVYIDSLNARGGVLGKKVRILTADDKFKPEETVKLIASMQGKVSALLPTTGSANLGLVFKQGILDKMDMPIVGTIPSNESFRSPLRRNIFHFRAGDRDQMAKMVEQLTTVGITRIAILARNNPSGAEGAGIIASEMQKRGIKPMVHVTYEVPSKDYAAQAKQMLELKPDGIILLGNPEGISFVARDLKKGGVTSLLYAVSNADFRHVFKTLGPEMARGFVISQVLPNLEKRSLPLIKDFREDFDKYANTKEEPTHFNLEGYISARLIVEAIRRTKDASPKGVIKGLEQLHDFDLGGYFVDLSPTKHAGSNWVDLSVINAAGRLVY